MVIWVNIGLIFCECVYQGDSSWLQAWCRGSGVHVVKESVYLPQRNSSSSVTDLKEESRREEEKRQAHTTFKHHIFSQDVLYMCIRV